jgi:hypothetical protein
MDRIGLDEPQIQRIRRLLAMRLGQPGMALGVQPDVQDRRRPAPIGVRGRGTDGNQRPVAETVQDPRASTPCPAAMDRTVLVGIDTDFGTGRSSRTSRCRHFARQPWLAVEICAEGEIRTNSGKGSCFCTAAAFCSRAAYAERLVNQA